MKYFVFDIESVGLHGETFAAGFVLVDSDTGRTIKEEMLACPPENVRGANKDLEWVKANIPPMNFEALGARDIRKWFCNQLMIAHDMHGAMVAADCPWPVEARFLNECVDYGILEEMYRPYPLIDITSMGLACGIDPFKPQIRLKREAPAHNPLNDARQSARLLLKCIKKMSK